MKKVIVLIIVLCSINCKRTNNEILNSTETNIKSSSKTKISEKTEKKTIPTKIKLLKIPFIENIDLNKTKEIKYKASESGDCGDITSMFKYKTSFITVDTSSCGDYGGTISKIILDSTQRIEKVYFKQYEPVGKEESIRETFIDFTTTTIVAKTRTDTIPYNNIISKKFKKDTLENPIDSFEHWTNYNNEIWEKYQITQNKLDTLTYIIKSNETDIEQFYQKLKLVKLDTNKIWFKINYENIISKGQIKGIGINEYSNSSIEKDKYNGRSYSIQEYTCEQNSFTYKIRLDVENEKYLKFISYSDKYTDNIPLKRTMMKNEH